MRSSAESIIGNGERDATCSHMMATNNPASYAPQLRRWTLQFTLRAFLVVTLLVSALVGYLLRPGHLTAGRVRVAFQVEGFEYQDFIEDTSDGEVESRSLMAMIRARNVSGNTLWYRGGFRECPDLIVASLRGDKWESLRTGFTPSHTYTLGDGETIRFGVSVDEDAKAMKVGVAFASKWFGTFHNAVLTDEIDVQQTINDMKDQDIDTRDTAPTERGRRESPARDTTTSPIEPDASTSRRSRATHGCSLVHSGGPTVPLPR